MNLCFRGGRANFGKVFLFTGAFGATFLTGYLVSGLGVAERTTTVDVPAVPVVKKIETVQSLDSCILSKPLRITDGDLEIISKPRANYTDVARTNETQGSVKLRVTFGANGKVGSVEPLLELPDGLTEQAIAAARRIEFKPAVKDGKTVTTTKIVEYTFTIF